MSIRHLGCDPELFLVNQTGQFISSVGLIGGSKDFPMPIGEGCSVQEDNVSVEFNTPPCASADEFVRSINFNKKYIAERAKELGLSLSIVPSAVFNDDQLNTEAAQTFGCEPDYNAWRGGMQNPRPHADNPNLRSAGGHIHIETNLDCIEVVKAMDAFVGCPMIEFDDDKDRRQLYGKPGAFRKKSYGVEYRTASNAWIQSEERIRWVWAQTEKAIQFVENGGTFSEEDGMLIQKCINESNQAALAELRLRFAGI
jgi:hypothetical protein